MSETKPSVASPLPLSFAIEYVTKYGWFIFPLHSIDSKTKKCSCKKPDCNANNQGKHPRTKNGVLDASNDIDTVRGWWTKWPSANIGLACGKSGVVVLDVDPRNGGDDTFAALEKEHGTLPNTVIQLTGGGGQHYLFTRPEGEQVRGTTIPDGIDIKADGGYIVLAPSTHLSGRNYVWDAGRHPADTSLKPCPEWMLKYTRGKSDEVQSNISPDDGYLGAAFRSAGWAGRDLGHGRIAVQCPWESEHSSGSRFDGSSVVFAPNSGNNTGWFWCSHSHCQTKRKLKDVIHALPEAARAAARKHLGLPDKHQPPPETEPCPSTGEAWEQSLRLTQDGTLTKDPGNAAVLIANLADWRGTVCYDEFSGKIRWARPAPTLDGMAPPLVGSELQDHHVIYVSQWLAVHRRVTFSRETVFAAIESAARLHGFNPLQDYLTHLQWDRVQRVPEWLTTYLGVEDTEYARVIGRWWLISAAARAMKPGCQVDHMLVLKGPQGTRKTSAFVALAGEHWGLESVPDLRDKDAMQILRGKWICIFNELEGIRGSGINRVKDFLTRRVDSFRPSYGRYSIEVPRACIFGATANDDYCLPVDPTGSRRFWPVTIGQVDIEALTADRDQIWAEAMHYLRAGEQWWPGDERVRGLIADATTEYLDTDPWQETIGFWADNREGFPFTVEECLRFAVGVTTDRMTRADQTRAGGILRGLGYEVRQVTEGGRRVRKYSNKWDQ